MSEEGETAKAHNQGHPHIEVHCNEAGQRSGQVMVFSLFGCCFFVIVRMLDCSRETLESIFSKTNFGESGVKTQ